MSEVTLEAHAADWDALAAEQDRDAGNPAARARAETYRRTAESLRIEARTGVAVCVCCYKPFGQPMRA